MSNATTYTDREAVYHLAQGFTSAWNHHDMEAFGGLFAPDAEFVNVAGMWWRGRPQIQGAHAHTHATFFKHSVLAGEVASVKFLSPEVGLHPHDVEPDRTYRAQWRGGSAAKRRSGADGDQV